MLLLHNSVQSYAWGTVDGLASLVGSAPTGGHEAELWVGTHPKAPSMVVGDPSGRSLADVIASDPARWLGPDLADEGHTSLPFLLKILAIGEPLSLQAHPSAAEARAGFAREEAAGVPIEAPERTYRDASPKPESLVALVETSTLCGFRTPEEAAALVGALGVGELAPLITALEQSAPVGLHDALAWILGLQGDERSAVARKAASAAASQSDSGPHRWMVRLAAEYPGDPSCLAPLLLHVVRLAPGEALHLPAGNLHAYLEGAGVEIMAASDNVLRGGLTPKHIDVAELLAILRFEPGVPARPVRADAGPGITTYDCHEPSFGLTLVEPDLGPVVIEPSGPSLLLATDGAVDVAGATSGLTLDHGDAAFVAPGEGPLTITGAGRLWWATIGSDLPR